MTKIRDTHFDVVGDPEFALESLLEADLASGKEEAEDITYAADKQLQIEHPF